MKPSPEILPGDSGRVSKKSDPDGGRGGVQRIRHLAIYQIIRVGKSIVPYLLTESISIYVLLSCRLNFVVRCYSEFGYSDTWSKRVIPKP